MLGQGNEERARPAHDGYERERRGSDDFERAWYERDEPHEEAERYEAVEVPRRVVREHAALPLALVGPRAKFFVLVLVRLFWRDWKKREG